MKVLKFQAPQENLEPDSDVPLQNTDEWLKNRLGKITASCFSKVLTKGGGVTRRKYMIQLAVERLTNRKEERYFSKEMEWGTMKEPEARGAYELISGAEVEQVGFIEIDGMIGCSPDGLVGEDGLLEIKCPNTSTHLDTFTKDDMPSNHKDQVQGQMMVTGREWVDFVSFDPRLPYKSQYFCKRIMRDDEYIDSELIPGIVGFSRDLDKLIIKLK